MFNDNDLKNLIENRLNNNVSIPNGHKGAAFAFTDGSSVQAGIAFRTLSSGWQVQGDVNYVPHSGELTAGLNIMKTW